MAAHRYWRVSDVMLVNARKFTGRITAKEMRFITKSGRLSNDPSKAASATRYSPAESVGNLFDGNDFTIYHPADIFTNPDYKNEWVSYDFGTPEEVIGLTARFRTDSYAAEWRFISAKIECSDDNVNWYLVGYANIKNDVASYTFEGDIEPYPYYDMIIVNLNINDYGGGFASPTAYSVNESGSFSGLVTQGESGEPKLPLKAEVLLYDRMTNNLMQRTWSDDLGVYSFNGVDTGREYYVVAIHPNRTYNAVIQDGLKSGMTA